MPRELRPSPVTGFRDCAPALSVIAVATKESIKRKGLSGSMGLLDIKAKGSKKGPLFDVSQVVKKFEMLWPNGTLGIWRLLHLS